jgi:hypothetical protein
MILPLTRLDGMNIIRQDLITRTPTSNFNELGFERGFDFVYLPKYDRFTVDAKPSTLATTTTPLSTAPPIQRITRLA